jgi:hypothetical protein
MADGQKPAQEQLAKVVTIIVLAGTISFGLLGISIGIVALSNAKGSIHDAKEILQFMCSAILPLFGTWIGTILAFYFSKDNLLAANQTVQHLVNKLTSDQKLASIKARGVMIPLVDLIYKNYPTGADDTKIFLETDFLDFLSTHSISRVILLNENKLIKYVLHKSIIEQFIAEQYRSLLNTALSSPPTAVIDPSAKLTFANFKASANIVIQNVLKDGAKVIQEEATLAEAKMIMMNVKLCNDVFLTKSGNSEEPVLGWITDKTIVENSTVA